MSSLYGLKVLSGKQMKPSLFRWILKKYWKLLLSMVFVSALGCAAMTGLSSGYLSLEKSFSNYLRDYQHPDAVITTAVTTRDKAEELLAVDGVSKVRVRLAGDTVVVSPAGRYLSVRAMSYDEEDIPLFYFWSRSEENSAYDPVLLEYNFAADNGIRAGDILQVKVRQEYRTYFVQGIVSAPETMAVQPAESAWGANSDFGYLYAPRDLLEKEPNPDYESAMREWQEKNEELAQAQSDAQEEYRQTQNELDSAEKDLNESIVQFNDTRKELENQRAELEQKKADALEQRAELESKKSEVLHQQAELEEKQTELQENQAELNQRKEELAQQQWELNEKRAEVESQQAELNRNLAEAKTQQKELDDGRAEAEGKRQELLLKQQELEEKEQQLDETEPTLQTQREAVLEGHREATRQMISLQKTKAQLLEGQKEIENAREQAIEKRSELLDTRAELMEKRAEVEQQLNLLRRAQDYLSRVDDAVRQADEAESVYAQAEAAVQEIDRLLSDLEGMQQALRQAKAALNVIDTALSAAEALGMDTAELLAQRQEVVDQLAAYGVSEDMIDLMLEQMDASIAQLRSQRAELIAQMSEMEDPERLQETAEKMQAQLDGMLSAYEASGSVSEAVLGDRIRQAEEGIAQIDDGVDQIDNGLVQIRDGLRQADEKEKEINEGLSQLEEGEVQLRDALRQMEEALPQLDDGLHRIWDGRQEIAAYRAQLADGFQQLQDTFDQLEVYQQQLDDGFAQLDELQQQLNDGFAQLDDYQAQINDGQTQIADYQAKIDGGTAQITDGLAQAADGLLQIEDGFSKLEEGLAQIDDGILQIDQAIAEGERQIADGKDQLSSKRSELESAWVDALSEFSHINQELQDALAELNEWEGYQVFCNQFLLSFAPGANRADALKAAETALGDAAIKSSLLHEDSAVGKRMDMNLVTVKALAGFMPMVFFLVVLIAVFLFMSLLIRQCRREIGILRALGFSQGSIRNLFCGIDLIISLLAIALGTAIGWGVTRYVGQYFANLFPLPVFTYAFDTYRYILSAVLTIAVGLAATLISTAVIGHIQPSEAMSRPAPGTAKIPGLARTLTKGAAPFVKFSVFSMLRNKKRFLFSVVCLAATVMMIFAAFSFIASKNQIMDQLFGQRIHFDCQVFLSDEADGELREELNDLPFVSDAEILRYYAADITYNGYAERATVNALEEKTGLMSVNGADDRPLSIPHEGIILEKHLAQKLGAAVGNTVLVGAVPVRVAAISDQSVNRFQYVSLHQAQALGESTLGSVICRIQEADEQSLLAYLTQRDDYLYCVFTRVFHQSNARLYATYDLAAWLIIGFAILIGLVIVVNVAQTNLLEQKKELCILRTLGFQHSELSRHWFVQSFLHFLFSCAVGLPSGVYVAKLALRQLTTADREYLYANGPREYLLTVGLVFLYIVLSHIISMHSLRRWDIVESVKEKE